MKVTVKTIDAGDREFDLPEEVSGVLFGAVNYYLLL